jgi:Skp family chaperone for outer membrane proteins
MTMTVFRRTCAALAAGLFVTAVVASPAFAQQKAARIAVIDPKRVYNEMQETKDLQVQLDAERQRLNAMSKEKEGEIENLRKQRQFMKADSPQVEEINKQLMQKAIDYEVWTKFSKLDAERSIKRQMRILFNKIDSATAEVAKQQGIDLILADQSPKLPDSLEGITPDQLGAALMSRHVLYATDNSDVSSAVIALLDSRYKAGGGGAAAPAAPAAPAPAAPAPKQK